MNPTALEIKRPATRSTPPVSPLGARRRATPAGEAGVEYWRIERVARFLDISKKRIYQLIQERRLRAVRLGPRQTRVIRESIDEYLAELLAAAEEEEGA